MKAVTNILIPVVFATLSCCGLFAGPLSAQNAAGASGNGAAGNAAAANAGTASTMSGNIGAASGTVGNTTSPAGTENGTAGTAQGNTSTAGSHSTAMNSSADSSQSPASSNGVSGNSSSTVGIAGSNQTSIQTSSNSTPQSYDVARTVVDALKASANVQTAARNVQIDQKLADEAAAKGRPNLTTSASASHFDQATKVSIGGSPPIQVLPSHTELLQINLGEQIDLLGEIRAATDQYRLQSLADQFILQQVRNTRILQAETTYFNLLRAQHQVQVAQANLANAQQNQIQAANQNAAGTGQKIDLLRANTQVAQNQQQLTQAINNQNVAQSDFNDLVGRPLDTPITLKDVPGVTVGESAPITGPVGSAIPNFSAFTISPQEIANIESPQYLSGGMKTALSNRPEILADQVNVRVAQTGITLARAGLEPSLSLDASGNYYPTTSFQNPRQRTAQITATLTIPLYDGNATHDRIEAARLRQQNAQTELESEQSDVTLDVRQAYLNLVTDANQIAAANTALEQAIAARQLAEVRYQGGVGLFLEVTDAQAALVQAENSQVNAVYDYFVAQAQYQNALGTPETR